MSWWQRILGRTQTAKPPKAASDGPTETATSKNTVDLPVEPYVFECQSCGKVFEARRRHPSCPECESTAVSLMSE